MKQELIDRPISELIEYATNPRNIGSDAVDKLAAMIHEFGFRVPIVAKSDGLVVDGHLRLQAAKKLGLETVPCLSADDMTDAQIKAFRIAVNKAAEFASWDEDALAAEIEELGEMDFEMELTGFDEDELNELLAEFEATDEGLTDPDSVPDAPVDPVTVPGDIWLLGKHRVMCGDSTIADAVEMLMDGEKADLVLTDPPYGTNQPGVPGDSPDVLQQVAMDSASIMETKDDCIAVVFQSPRLFLAWLNAMDSAGYSFERMLWLYKEAQCTFPWRGWILTSESILIFSKGRPEWQDIHPYSHDCYKLSEVSGEISKEIGWHGSVKPQKVLIDLITRTSKRNSLCVDMFGGSGSTLIACEKTGRICRMMELDPKYCDVIVKRWQDFTGKQAVHEESGKSYNKIAKE